MTVEWIMTRDGPRARVGFMGRVGWRRHAVKCSPTDSYDALKGKRALCGLLPRYGWDDDLYIPENEAHCERCTAALARAER